MTTSTTELDILLIEDDEGDYLITQALLDRAQTIECTLDWASTYDEGRDAILTDDYDACLVDYRLGASTGLDLLEEVNAQGGVRAPIILLTGQGDLEVDLHAMEAGAADYLSKDQIDAPLLERSLRYAVERREAEQRIREQAQLLDKARDAILAHDMDGRIVYWNKSAERLTGWSKDEILGERTHSCLYDPDEEDKLRRCRETLMAEGEWTGELHMRTRDDEELIVESRWTLVRDESGAPDRVLVINTDITERKRLESQFLRSQRMESIGRLVGGIAHDLGNLLMPITLGVKVLRRRLEQTDDKIEQVLSMIQKSAERGGNMVEQVLAFARGVEGERVALQLDGIVDEIENITDETFPETIEVQTDVAEDLPRVVGDATQIQQVLMNLCVNARDAMPEGGTLSIAACPVELTEADAERNIDAEPGPYVCLRVQDTGTGMPEDVMDKIFEPFYSTKDEGEGTGLGLSTAYSIIQSHDGFIDVDSEEGEGTTFWVYLPVRTEDEERPARPAEPDAAAATGNGEQVLVVDDEEFILETTREALRDVGYRVLTATGGEEALRALEEADGAVDVVVTDLRMPDMDGFDLIRTLRARNPSLPIVAASGVADGRTDEALDAGAHAFLAKPFTAETLQSALHEALHAPDEVSTP
jgi:PAS domain S-box-containing protein